MRINYEGISVIEATRIQNELRTKVDIALYQMVGMNLSDYLHQLPAEGSVFIMEMGKE